MDEETALYHKQRGTSGLGLFDSAVARDKDPLTSHKGHDRIAPKRGSQCATLLSVYLAYPDGLTDREAGERSGVPSSWKRSSDLRKAGHIVPTGEERDGQMVCRPT